MHSHIIICGERGVGKSTLISRLLANTDRPVYGCCTRALSRPDGSFEVFMFAPGDFDHARPFAKRIGAVRSVDTTVFNTFGVELLSRVKEGGIILLDELGFMEEQAEAFTKRVLELFDGDIPVIAAVKSTHPDSAFLNRVRNHPKADVYYIDENNRDSLYRELADDRRLK